MVGIKQFTDQQSKEIISPTAEPPMTYKGTAAEDVEALVPLQTH